MTAFFPGRPIAVNRGGTMAHRLLPHSGMELGRWQKLNPSTLETVPEEPGIFEIANLVRTVLYVGRADGSLRRRLEGLGAVPTNVPASTGGYYVRWATSADEAAALAEAEAAHRARLRGRLPAGNEGVVRPTIRLVTRNAA